MLEKQPTSRIPSNYSFLNIHLSFRAVFLPNWITQVDHYKLVSRIEKLQCNKCYDDFDQLILYRSEFCDKLQTDWCHFLPFVGWLSLFLRLHRSYSFEWDLLNKTIKRPLKGWVTQNNWFIAFNIFVFYPFSSFHEQHSFSFLFLTYRISITLSLKDISYDNYCTPSEYIQTQRWKRQLTLQ